MQQVGILLNKKQDTQNSSEIQENSGSPEKLNENKYCFGLQLNKYWFWEHR